MYFDMQMQNASPVVTVMWCKALQPDMNMEDANYIGALSPSKLDTPLRPSILALYSGKHMGLLVSWVCSRQSTCPPPPYLFWICRLEMITSKWGMHFTLSLQNRKCIVKIDVTGWSHPKVQNLEHLQHGMVGRSWTQEGWHDWGRQESQGDMGMARVSIVEIETFRENKEARRSNFKSCLCLLARWCESWT
jgi:hypothetical protein